MGVFRRIRPQIGLLAAVPLLVICGILVLIGLLEVETRDAAAWLQHSDAVIGQLQLIQRLELQNESATGTYVALHAPGAQHAFSKAHYDLENAISGLQNLVKGDATESAYASSLVDALHARMAILGDIVTSMNERGSAATLPLFRRPESTSASRRLADTYAAFESGERRMRAAREARLSDRWKTLSVAIIVGSFITAAVTLALVSLLGVRLVRRLDYLVRRTRRFARTGTLLPEVGGLDEIADVDHAFTQMADIVRTREGDLLRYQLLAEHARDGIFFYRSSDDQIVEVNHAAAKMYGYSHDALVKMKWSALFDERGVHRRDSALYEAVHRRSNGTTFPVEVASARALIDHEELVLSIVRDVTERRRSDEAVRSALHQAVEASRLKSQFVATMSHEIRTPMNAVIGMSELLLDTSLSDEQREYATILRDAGHTLLSVINDILDFSKIEAGKVDLETIEFDPLSVVEGVAALLATQAHSKNISLMTYVDPAIPHRLLGDPDRLRQVLVNLVGNAIKFTHRGGVVATADLIDRGAEFVRINFRVHDTGIGIAQAAIPNLFEPFRQADGTTTRRYGGTGLGLTICKRIVELMGGTLSVESNLGEGSTFAFDLDLPPVTAPVEETPSCVLGDVRVLVVDDDPVARDILWRYLTSWGFPSGMAAGADDAFALAIRAVEQNEPFRVALVDLRLQDVDGFAFLSRVQSDPRLSGMKLALITAFDEIAQGRRAIEAGFSDYLVKPVRQSQLFDSIVRAALGDQAFVFADRKELIHPETEVPVSAMGPSNGTSYRILLAEDNVVNQRLAIRQLERLGYSADIAENGARAVELAATGEYALVLMDCQMPELDGFEATREIRRAEKRTGEHIPIVAMTANALAEDRDACVAAGMDDYIAKPVSLDTLRKTLTSWLRDRPALVEPGRIIDRARLHDLFGRDEDAITEFLSMALPSIDGLCERVLSATDRTQMRELAHELKGTAANIGAEELSRTAKAVESALKYGEPGDELQTLLETLAKARVRFMDVMKQQPERIKG